MKSPQNFERLVLGCMDSYDSEKRRILQGFSRSTRFAFLCTALNSNLQSFAPLIFAIFSWFLQNFAEFSFKSVIFAAIFIEFCRNCGKTQMIVKIRCILQNLGEIFEIFWENLQIFAEEKACWLAVCRMTPPPRRVINKSLNSPGEEWTAGCAEARDRGEDPAGGCG